MSVDGARTRILGFEALDGGDDDHETSGEVLGAHRFEALSRHDEGAAPGFDKLFAVWVSSRGKGGEGLFENSLGRDKPEYMERLGVGIRVAYDSQGTRREPGLAASGRDTDTDVGYITHAWSLVPASN
jgi:hypothetical protein